MPIVAVVDETTGKVINVIVASLTDPMPKGRILKEVPVGIPIDQDWTWDPHVPSFVDNRARLDPISGEGA